MNMAVPKPPRCSHMGDVAVRVGEYQLYPSGAMYLTESDFARYPNRLLVPLARTTLRLNESHVIWSILPDFGGVPDTWEEFLRGEIIPLLGAGSELMPFCMASHGRTGTFLASLVALLESEQETPDPIAAVRERHCPRAVESVLQAEAIFALRGQEAPLYYRTSLFR